MINLEDIIEIQKPSLITYLNESDRDIDLFVLVSKANYRTHVKNEYYRTDLHLYSEHDIFSRVKWQQLTCPIIFGLYSPVLFGDNTLKTLIDEIPIPTLFRMLKFSIIGEFGSKSHLSLKESKYFIKDIGLLLTIRQHRKINEDAVAGWKASLLDHITMKMYYYQTHENGQGLSEIEVETILNYLFQLRY